MNRQYDLKEKNYCECAKIAWLINEEEGTTLTDADVYDNMNNYDLIRIVPIETAHTWDKASHGMVELSATHCVIYDK